MPNIGRIKCSTLININNSSSSYRNPAYFRLLKVSAAVAVPAAPDGPGMPDGIDAVPYGKG